MHLVINLFSELKNNCDVDLEKTLFNISKYFAKMFQLKILIVGNLTNHS